MGGSSNRVPVWAFDVISLRFPKLFLVNVFVGPFYGGDFDAI